jgi:hypothetical protein
MSASEPTGTDRDRGPQTQSMEQSLMADLRIQTMTMSRKLGAAVLGIALASACQSLCAAPASTPEWAFDRPDQAVLRSSKRKVFAHYFSPFPISIDNKDPENDYYQGGFLSLDGERGKHRNYGGYLRQRPLPRPPRPEEDWKLRDMMHEVELASRAGLDGFCFDILGVGEKSVHWKRLKLLLEAAKRVDPEFRIMLMPDMMAHYRGKPEAFVPSILEVAEHPSLYRLDDGRLVIAPYNAHVQKPEWWQEQLAALADKGVEVAFVPLFQAWWKYADDYAPLAYGLSDWGAGTADELLTGGRTESPQKAHALGKLWMAPVRPQDFRPKSYLGFEAHNTALFRRMWSIAIDGQADWVQLITWNDYSEASEIAPSTCTQYMLYDLTAYYTAWFKLGTPPKIKRDALYYTYRVQRTDAKPDPEKQSKPFRVRGARPYDEIELLALLTAPGTLEIAIGDTVKRQDVEAGLQTLRVPLQSGTPVFRLIRGGKTAMEVTGKWEIDASDNVVFQNLLYHAGGGTKESIANGSRQ